MLRAIAVALFVALLFPMIAHADVILPGGRSRRDVEHERWWDEQMRQRRRRDEQAPAVPAEQPQHPNAEPVDDDVDTSDDSLGYVVLGALGLWTAAYVFRRRGLSQEPRHA